MSLIPRIEEAAKEVSLNNEEVKRYSRHLIMPEVTLEGQQKLKAARVLCIGTGGLGSPLLAYLGAAGVGHLGIVDFDIVDESNLQRQIIHSTENVGKPKVESAEVYLKDVNPFVEVKTYNVPFKADNALEIMKDYDIIVDGTDNFPTRYLVDDACNILGKPNVYGSIFRFEGQATVFWAAQGPCYRDLYPDPPPAGMVPSCAEGGVLGVLPGVIGQIQAIETIKLITGIGDPLLGRLLLYDALKMSFREMKLRKDPNRKEITELIDYEQFCGMPALEAEAPAQVSDIPEITATELKKRMDAEPDLTVIDVREPFEYEIAKIPGTQLIPLGQVEGAAGDLNPEGEIILHCKSGKRSAQALDTLREKGFSKLLNLKGGIEAWSDEVDSSVAKY